MRGSQRGVIDELVVELLVNGGLRAQELCSLDIRDLPVSHGKPVIYVRDGKGKVSRSIDVPQSLEQRLQRFVRLYRKGAKPESPLFVNARGKRVIYRSIYEKIKKLGKNSGIGHLHPHMLRHTYGTRLYNVEMDLRFVQDQLGHASPTTTAIYAKTNSKARRRQVQALDEI
ncbi:tyrosine-type recombinase/integrase [Planctomycetota bacterium]